MDVRRGLLLLFWAWGTAQAGIGIRPMLVSHEAIAGTRSHVTFQLENRQSPRQRVHLELVELVQDASGLYGPLDPNRLHEQDTPDLGGRATCRGWLSFPGRAEQISLERGTTTNLVLTIDTPAQASGFYCAAALLEVVTETRDTPLTARFDYVIPILVHIKDRPEPCEIELVRVALDQCAQAPASSTTIRMEVHNNGRSYHRLRASARIESLSNDRWHPLGGDIEIKVLSIIPGSRLKLERTLQTRLLPGRYQIFARLSIDGGLPHLLRQEAILSD